MVEGDGGPPSCLGAGPSCRDAGHLCFEAEGYTKSTNWSYVGEGRGGYEMIKTYNYVGEGCGRFEKPEEREGRCLRSAGAPRSLCINVFVALSLVMALAGTVCLVIAVLSVPTARKGGADSSDLTSGPGFETAMAIQPAAPFLHYDCRVNYADWEDQWSKAQQKWCCAHWGRGCTTTVPPNRQLKCNAICVVDHRAATCQERIQWVAKHRSFGQQDACMSAYGVVLKECPVCGACPLTSTGCAV